MKRVFLFGCLLALAASAWACPAGAVLIKQYGVSFSGFSTPIPATKTPATPLDDFIEVELPDQTRVSDGFSHTAYIDPARHQAWIHRTGGFLAVHEWYGPVSASNLPLAGCLTRKQLQQQAPAPALRVPSL